MKRVRIPVSSSRPKGPPAGLHTRYGLLSKRNGCQNWADGWFSPSRGSFSVVSVFHVLPSSFEVRMTKSDAVPSLAACSKVSMSVPLAEPLCWRRMMRE